MDRIFVILGWIVMATLALAIARQLSEHQLVFHPSLLEGYTSQRPAEAQVEDPAKNETLTAKTCYETDFISQTQLGGDYTQRTNNFKHAKPDNCSAPLTELVNKFY
jgi:hypothetical protein